MVSRRVASLIKSIVLVVSFLMLGAGVGAPGNNLHAEECLSAPDSPSPQGTHWHYRLDWATQRKCWYLRAPARSLRRAAAAATATATPAPPEHQEECLSAPDSPSPQGTHWRYRLDWPTQRKCWYLGAPARSLRRAAAATPATPVLFGRRHSVDSPPKSMNPADAASPSSQVDMLPIDPPISEGITTKGGRLLQQSVPEDISAPAPIGPPCPATKHVVADWQRGGRTGCCSYDVVRSGAHGCSGSGTKSDCHPNQYTCGFSVL